jgi:hydrogenase maturation protein HypF
LKRADGLTGTKARRWLIGGQVQGVGFRPFVYRLAHRLGVSGWVRNRMGQVEIIAEGDATELAELGRALTEEAPPIARPVIERYEPLPARGLRRFEILDSAQGGLPQIHLPPDYSTCADCLRELNHPRDRRHHYPFINCTQCGPRYTIIRALPYDRPNTTMAGFPLCPDCRREYQDPLDRRFHAEPIACPVCGPRLRFIAPGQAPVDETRAALAHCVAALEAGRIVAVKGIGGYHLMCDALNEAAITRLRARKPRPHKPLAVMFRTLAGLEREAALGPGEGAFLESPMRPILLVHKRPDTALPELIAPRLSEIGVMLPYSPLHHLLLDAFGGALVATSGNISGEPVLTEEADVVGRLGAVAEACLHHDRPIERPADDPVFRTIRAHPRPMRLGRGVAPLEMGLPRDLSRPVLAVGGHMKHSIALAWAARVVVSPHIGDMDTPRSLRVFEALVRDLQALYGVQAEAVVCDAHPGYTTSRWARRCGLPVHEVLHHHAHASALAGEYPDRDEDWLAFTWDATGFGADGTIWGGETLLGRPGAWRRVASLRPFFLPGGDKAGREPWRSAAALCWELGQVWTDCPDGSGLACAAWERRLNCPQSTAMGRVFDAAAALVTGIHTTSYEGQGPMGLEALCARDGEALALPLGRDREGLWRLDWAPLVARLRDADLAPAQRAADLHATLARSILDQAMLFRDEQGVDRVGLTGGVFQNRGLSEQAAGLLQAQGFEVVLSQAVPCNDGGIGFGQVIEYSARAPT